MKQKIIVLLGTFLMSLIIVSNFATATKVSDLKSIVPADYTKSDYLALFIEKALQLELDSLSDDDILYLTGNEEQSFGIKNKSNKDYAKIINETIFGDNEIFFTEDSNSEFWKQIKENTDWGNYHLPEKKNYNAVNLINLVMYDFSTNMGDIDWDLSKELKGKSKEEFIKNIKDNVTNTSKVFTAKSNEIERNPMTYGNKIVYILDIELENSPLIFKEFAYHFYNEAENNGNPYRLLQRMIASTIYLPKDYLTYFNINNNFDEYFKDGVSEAAINSGINSISSKVDINAGTGYEDCQTDYDYLKVLCYIILQCIEQGQDIPTILNNYDSVSNDNIKQIQTFIANNENITSLYQTQIDTDYLFEIDNNINTYYKNFIISLYLMKNKDNVEFFNKPDNSSISYKSDTFNIELTTEEKYSLIQIFEQSNLKTKGLIKLKTMKVYDDIVEFPLLSLGLNEQQVAETLSLLSGDLTQEAKSLIEQATIDDTNIIADKYVSCIGVHSPINIMTMTSTFSYTTILSEYQEIKQSLEAQYKNISNSIFLDYTCWKYLLTYYYYKMQNNQDERIDNFANSIINESVAGTTTADIHAEKILDREAFSTYSDSLSIIYQIGADISQNMSAKVLWGKGEFSSEEYLLMAETIYTVKDTIDFLENLGLSENVVDFWYNYKYSKSDWLHGNKVKNTPDEITLQDVYEIINNLDLSLISKQMSLYSNDEEKALGDFFTISNNKVTQIRSELLQGIKFSSTFVPLKTNLYDPASWLELDIDNFYDFHYMYGYHRKALYIDTNSSAAVDYYMTDGKQGNTRVCTLSDLLSCEKDIILYVDDNFYNVDEVASAMNLNWERLDNVDAESDSRIADNSNPIKWFLNRMTDTFTLDAGEICKSAEHSRYSSSLQYVESYAQTKQKSNWWTKIRAKVAIKNATILDGDNIDLYLNPDRYVGDSGIGDDDTSNPKEDLPENSYSAIRGFAFVSAIYRDKDALKYFNDNLNRGLRPVFVSSKILALQEEVDSFAYKALINYTMLKNISKDSVASYKMSLDMDSPVYIDIYGNILTESGYVIIPAAANATLNWGDNTQKYLPYNVAFLHSYGKEFYIPTTYKDVEQYLEFLEIDEENERYVLKSATLNNKVSLNQLSLGSKDTQITLYNIYSTSFSNNDIRKHFDIDTYVIYVFSEVMRGCPLENIDKAKEGLSIARLTLKNIGGAVALEKLKNSLGTLSTNTLIAMPDLTTYGVMEYIILILYKGLLLIVTLMVMIQVIAAGFRQEFNLSTFVKIILNIVLTVACLVFIPKLYNLTQYGSSRLLLQNETEYIAMLNNEKTNEGAEITMTDIIEPKDNSTLYITLDTLDVRWYELIDDVITVPIGSKLDELFNRYIERNLTTDKKDFFLHNDEVRIDLQTLFDSSSIIINQDYHYLYQNYNTEADVAFYLPYYNFIDKIISEVQSYNLSNDVYSYVTQVYRTGSIKSIGLIENYYTSDEYAEDDEMDHWGIRDIYNIKEGAVTELDEILSIAQSFGNTDYSEDSNINYKEALWYNDNLTAKDVEERVELMNEEGKKWIYDNRNLLGRISDETIIKSYALHMALYYNKLFNIGSADAIEISNLNFDDLMKLSTTNKETVLKDSCMSYSRFIFFNSGEAGVFVAIALTVIIFILQFIRPIATIIIFVCIYISIFLYRIIMNKKSDNIKGLIFMTVLTCTINMLYSILIKLCIYLPRIGFTSTTCLIFQCIFHSLFILIFSSIALFAVRHIIDLGYGYLKIKTVDIKEAKFNTKTNNILHNKQEIAKRAKDDDAWKLLYDLNESEDRKRKLYTNRRHKDNDII